MPLTARADVDEESPTWSHDGTKIALYPALIRIHGGPTAQDVHSFQFERQFFAAHGYLVLGINYRGSSGRGAKYSEAIYQD